MSSSSSAAASPVSRDGSDSVVSASSSAVSRPGKFHLTFDPPLKHFFESRFLLPSTRVEFPPVMDRHILESSIAALYNRLDAQTAVVYSYRSLEDALREQEVRSNRLERALQSFQELATPLSKFVLDRYKRLHQRYDTTIQKAQEFEDELGLREDQSQEIASLKTALLKANTANQHAQERHRREMAVVDQVLKDQFQLLLASFQDRLDKLQATQDDLLNENLRKDVSLDQLRGIILDRDGTRSGRS
ncbi:unnamed protein product [Peronospora effusa]|nr:unnamed protein product [Peronospora effusa]